MSRNKIKIFHDTRFKDKRGYLWTSWKKNKIKLRFNHDKFAVSKKNVFRGLHYDNKTWKLVSCVYGKIFLVIVNLDKKTGDIIWSTDSFKILKKRKFEIQATGYILGSDKMIITTSNGYIIVCSANSGIPLSLKKIGDPISSPPIISGGSLYLLTKNYRLIGFN